MKTKEVKRSHKEFQSGSCPLGGETNLRMLMIYIMDLHVMVMLCISLTINLGYLPKFDNLLPELELSIRVILC